MTLRKNATGVKGASQVSSCFISYCSHVVDCCFCLIASRHPRGTELLVGQSGHTVSSSSGPGTEVCVKSTHAFVFSRCTHGKVDSVLETFDLYAETHSSLCVGPLIGEVLDEVMRRVCPSLLLELGMHCGYSSVRLLRLLPPAGRLITVELDPLTADLGEEIILFQVLTSSSAEAIPALRSFLEPERGTGDGFSLVLMDHDPQQYFLDLLALEREELLCPTGCSVLLINKNQRAEAVREILDHVRARADCY